MRYLLRSGSVWSDQVATVCDHETRTYSEMVADVEHLAGALRDQGVERGDRVASLLPNVPAMLDLHFAAAGIGAVLVPMNTRLSDREYAYILEHSGARLLVTGGALGHRIGPLLDDIPASPQKLEVGAGLDYLPSPNAPVPLTTADEDALLAINYTSGTTGKPKGVMYCHRGAYLHALGVIAESRLTPESGYLWTLPMFHCNGWAFTWAVTAMGGRHLCLPVIEPDAIWERLRGGEVTHLCAAPTVVTMLLDSAAAARLESPVELFVGGAPPSPSLVARSQALGIRVTHLYGLTETYGPIAVCAWQPSWNALPEHEQAGRRARQGVATVVSEGLRVVDETMRDVPADGVTTGEVVMRGDNVMLGYYRDPEATDEALRGGWFHSGDLAVIHPDGYVELKDRIKDVIISGGENISTIEVEQALAAHPAVADVAVVAMPDERWGEVPLAFVVLARNHEATVDELRAFAREHLAAFKIPRRIQFSEELPKTATGKVQKYLLKASVPSG